MPSTKRKRDATPQLSGERFLRIIALLVLAAIFAVGGLGLGNPNRNVTGSDIPPTPGPGSPTALIFPTVPPGGVTVVPDRTYFHSTALFSMPHLLGWDLAQNGEERVEPGPGSKLTRVGATFINGNLLSVVHAFVENDPDRTAKTLADLDKFYDKANLDAAWSNFTGGWKETGRRTDSDRFVIDFQLGLNGNNYLGRQVSHFEQGWLMVTRLVAPDNNPALLDQLQGILWSSFVFYPSAAQSPASWSATADSVLGYVIKYPADWRPLEGEPGKPFVINGTLRDVSVTLTTKAEPGKSAKTEQDARAWVSALRPKATILTVSPETRGDAAGFSISYNDPDPDGNARSAVVTLLNGTNGTLYSANFLTSVRGLDLLKPDATVPPELAQIRATYLLLSTARFVATLTPTVTPTATATLPVTSTPPVTPTALVPTVVPPTTLPAATATVRPAF